MSLKLFEGFPGNGACEGEGFALRLGRIDSRVGQQRAKEGSALGMVAHIGQARGLRMNAGSLSAEA